MPSDVSVTSIDGNLLSGTLLSNSGYYYYNGRAADNRGGTSWGNLVDWDANTMRVLSVNAKGVLGFYKLADGSYMKPNRAWLTGDFSSSSAKSFQVVFDDNDPAVTGIAGVSAPLPQEELGKASWYNLQGQRVDHPTKGIFIHNGKKVILH